MAEWDCRKCKRWRGCPGKDWYNYGEIRWCPLQVIWILQNAETLRAGIYPPRHENSGESRQLRGEGYFVKPVSIIIEVDERLKRTGSQGELLVTQVEDGRTLGTLSDGAWEVLMYVKGNKRKRKSFSAWKKERKYRYSVLKGMQS